MGAVKRRVTQSLANMILSAWADELRCPGSVGISLPEEIASGKVVPPRPRKSPLLSPRDEVGPSRQTEGIGR